jgi:hypothetical protein
MVTTPADPVIRKPTLPPAIKAAPSAPVTLSTAGGPGVKLSSTDLVVQSDRIALVPGAPATPPNGVESPDLGELDEELQDALITDALRELDLFAAEASDPPPPAPPVAGVADPALEPPESFPSETNPTEQPTSVMHATVPEPGANRPPITPRAPLVPKKVAVADAPVPVPVPSMAASMATRSAVPVAAGVNGGKPTSPEEWSYVDPNGHVPDDDQVASHGAEESLHETSWDPW